MSSPTSPASRLSTSGIGSNIYKQGATAAAVAKAAKEFITAWRALKS